MLGYNFCYLSKLKLKKLIVILSVFFVNFQAVLAQNPCFSADKDVNGIVRGCAPLTIQMINCSNVQNVQYKYSDAEGFVPRTSNTYTQPGKYSITQVIQRVGLPDAILTRQDYVEVLPSPAPVFTVKYCANREVSLEISDNTYEQYIINWGDASATQAVAKGAAPTRHIYGSLNNFVITVQGRYLPGDCGGENSILITPQIALPNPTIQSITTQTLNVNSGSIDLRIPTDANFNYSIMSNLSPTPLASFAGTGEVLTQTLQNFNTESQTYCFQVKVSDACNNSLSSAIVYCNQNLKVLAQDSKNVIQWSAYGSLSVANAFLRYVLYRNNQPISSFTDINQIEYIDNEVICGQNYCYYLTAEFNSPTFNFTSKTNSACVTTFSTIVPPPVTQLNSTVETSRSIRVFWQVPNQPRIVEYRIKRSGQALTSNSSQQSFIDTDLKITQSICYEISYQNECGNSSQSSQTTCPVFLETQPAPQGIVRLVWTPYRNSENLFETYVVQKLDDEGKVYEEMPIFSSIITEYLDRDAKTDRQIMRYRIKTVINSATNLVSYSNIVEAKQQFKVFFPNAFKPDGINNVFAPKGLFIKKFRMVIYNRAGQELFTSGGFTEGWDGTYKGGPAESGTYIYVAEMEDYLGEKFSTQGTFVLIR